MPSFLHFFFPNALSEYQDRLLAHCCQTSNGADCNTGPAGIHRIIRSFATCTRARQRIVPLAPETGLHWWLMLVKLETAAAMSEEKSSFIGRLTSSGVHKPPLSLTFLIDKTSWSGHPYQLGHKFFLKLQIYIALSITQIHMQDGVQK